MNSQHVLAFAAGVLVGWLVVPMLAGALTRG